MELIKTKFQRQEVASNPLKTVQEANPKTLGKYLTANRS